jgi:hypothetical protein
MVLLELQILEVVVVVDHLFGMVVMVEVEL